ncbi:MAG: type IV pilus twitching motility protein PilT [Nitrospirae bacterium]|nr:type IV pilus twitching motility protein PilT [Candidatus Troglogloeales bacterium]
MDIDALLKESIGANSSDLHVKVGCHPTIRVGGKLFPLDHYPKLTKPDVLALVDKMMTPEQKEKSKGKLECDFAYSQSGLGRFRVNIFQQRGSPGLAFRIVPATILSAEALMLPPVIEKLSKEARGLILITGTTGSGKSTTLAAMIEHINQHRACNILTIEDPIEYLFHDKKCLISQREVGPDTESFASALRSALRQDPDVILVGEMRDFETIQTALIAAETGHLVFSTLHTLDAVETINRIISVFPPYHQKQIRVQLASVICSIISMRLVPRATGKGRVPAVEIMLTTSSIREAIMDPEKTRRIHDLIATGRSQYMMQTFDQSLHDLCQKELITFAEALKWCSNPADFELKNKGVQVTSESWEEVQQQIRDTGSREPKKPTTTPQAPQKTSVDRFGT